MIRRAKQLAPDELITIVDALQQALYLDVGADRAFIWNPDKTWDGADVCEALATQLAEFGLTPTEVEPFS
jgi:hypothetical protein